MKLHPVFGIAYFASHPKYGMNNKVLLTPYKWFLCDLKVLVQFKVTRTYPFDSITF